MGHIVKGHRWRMPIAYKIGSAVDPTVRTRILDCLQVIQSQTNARFRYRVSEDDYVLFKKWDEGYGQSSDLGNEGTFLGFGGGRQEISLPKDAQPALIAHEICHAIGLAHEHQRRDRNSHITVQWGNIDPDHTDQFKKKSAGSTQHHGSYDQDSLMHYRGNAFGLYDWSDGWTSIAFHRIGNKTLLITLKKASGIIHVAEVAFAMVGATIQTKNWTSGYSAMVPFSTVGASRHFVFLLKSSDGTVKVHQLSATGIGNGVYASDWTPGWTSAAFYMAGGRTFLLILKQHDGSVHVHEMNADGTVGVRTDTRDWSAGWTQAQTYATLQADGTWRSFLFLLKAGNGRVHIHELLATGQIGPQLRTYNWSSGWSRVAFSNNGYATHLILLKTSNGVIHVHAMNADGSVGGRTGTYNWTSGYTSLATHTPSSGTPYLMILKNNSGIGHVHYFSNGSIGSRVAPATLVAHNGRSMGGAGRSITKLLTAGDVAAINRLIPFSVKPLRPYPIP